MNEFDPNKIVSLSSEKIDAKTLYIIEWIMNECDGEHQDLDPRTLGTFNLTVMAQVAQEAWDSGARCYDDDGNAIEGLVRFAH